VTVRILADREPYSVFLDEATTGVQVGPFRFLNGPPFLDEAAPELIVMPAVDFLTMRLLRDPRHGWPRPSYIVYGPVALMADSFLRGCVDYLREPWTMPELIARLGRLFGFAFRARGSTFILTGSTLRCEDSSVELLPDEIALLRLLVQNAPKPVTCKDYSEEFASIALVAARLKRKCKLLEPEFGKCFHVIRGSGYRLDAFACGQVVG